MCKNFEILYFLQKLSDMDHIALNIQIFISIEIGLIVLPINFHKIIWTADRFEIDFEH